MKDAYDFLQDKPLFSRLTRNKDRIHSTEIIRLIEKMEIIEKKQGHIIFNEPKYVYIVLNGRVVLRYHEEDPLEYQYIA